MAVAESALAMVSVVSSSVVGIAGLATAALVAAANRRGELTRIREERTQTRRAEAYVSLLQATERTGIWAQNLKPTLSYVGHEDEPSPMDDEKWSVVQAKLQAFGSAEVDELRKQWIEAVNAIAHAAWDLEYRKVHKDELPAEMAGKTSFQIYRDLDKELRPAERKARDAVAARVRAELSQPTPPTATLGRWAIRRGAR